MEPTSVLVAILCFFAAQSSPGMGKTSVLDLRNEVSKAQFDPTHVTHISWAPRAFLYEGFLTDDECDHLISLGKNKLERSKIVSDDDGDQNIESDYRTSYGMFLNSAQDEIVTRIEARIAAWTFLPEENGEAIQILRYEKGQKYDVHGDFSEDEQAAKDKEGNRIATVLMYLSNVEKGGETVFPYSERKHEQVKDGDGSECAKQGYAVKPKKGSALLFFSLYPNGTTDPSSIHGACPVIEGEKWSATKWIHVRTFDEQWRPKGCVDESPNCRAWALRGECDKNRAFMVGVIGNLGYCRKSCKACSTSSL